MRDIFVIFFAIIVCSCTSNKPENHILEPDPVQAELMTAKVGEFVSSVKEDVNILKNGKYKDRDIELSDNYGFTHGANGINYVRLTVIGSILGDDLINDVENITSEKMKDYEIRSVSIIYEIREVRRKVDYKSRLALPDK